ncbi:MAG: ArsR/SmtB family transcription factor [Planctomycetota bacterium]|jgi:ArsR family transcriptional regulator
MESGLLRSLASLGDMARLRLLRLVEQEELSVGELARVLQLPQSTVSRHLKVLYESEWIERRSEGTASLYWMDGEALSPSARALWDVVHGQLGESPTLGEDDHRMSEVLSERRTDSSAFFGRIVGEWDRLRRELFGEAFGGEALLSFLNPDWIVADLGCGTGCTAELLAPVVGRVIAVDREPAMLDAARKRLDRFDNVELVRGDVTGLSLGDEQVHAAILSLVMVSLGEPQVAVREIARILRPGGLALVVDMVPHDRESYRHTMGHDAKAPSALRRSSTLARKRLLCGLGILAGVGLVLSGCSSTPDTSSHPSGSSTSSASSPSSPSRSSRTTKAANPGGAINALCPMSGIPINPKIPTAEYGGQKIGFCSNRCEPAWNNLGKAKRDAFVAKNK